MLQGHPEPPRRCTRAEQKPEARVQIFPLHFAAVKTCPPSHTKSSSSRASYQRLQLPGLMESGLIPKAPAPSTQAAPAWNISVLN
eukprot:1612843-Heterocapsa_arctica.AAC.1